jgi:hypothetical protein
MATGVWCSFCASRPLERPGSRPECGSGLAPAGSVHEILRQTGIHPGHIGVYVYLFGPSFWVHVTQASDTCLASPSDGA